MEEAGEPTGLLTVQHPLSPPEGDQTPRGSSQGAVEDEEAPTAAARCLTLQLMFTVCVNLLSGPETQCLEVGLCIPELLLLGCSELQYLVTPEGDTQTHLHILGEQLLLESVC